jgi:hypothetical protein
MPVGFSAGAVAAEGAGEGDSCAVTGETQSITSQTKNPNASKPKRGNFVRLIICLSNSSFKLWNRASKYTLA